MQATLHVKLTINASPYQYGAGLLSYMPLVDMGNGTTSGPVSYPAIDSFSGGITDPQLNGYYSGGSMSGNLIVKTCRPCAWFYPQFSQGAEMVLPFCYYKNWVNLDTALTEVKNLGKLTIYSPTNLQTTGTTTINPVSVTIFAWCEMHKVSAPSYAMQGGDEYQDRPVSTTMSALSVLARTVARVPMLAPYAMATSSVLASLGTAARWFGYSNPPVIADVHAMRPSYMSSYASPEVCVQHDKLALDPKNEVTVDSRTVGLDGVDHMSIAHIIGREVYYGVVQWGATTTANTCLFITHVTPMVYTSRTYAGSITGLSVKSIQMTPACQVGTLFDMWHGTIKYKFTVIASQFHRGRLLVSYEPDGFQDSYTSSAYTSPRTISKIWDITENPSFEFEVPWMASTGFLKTGGFQDVAVGTMYPDGSYPNTQQVYYFNPGALPGTWRYSDGSQNGSIVVSVLNALTSGNTTAGVDLLVSMNCSDVEFSNPRDLDMPMNLSTYTLQGGEDTLAEDPNSVQQASVAAYQPPAKHLVYCGEIVRSVRALMHRTNFYTRYYTVTDSQTVVARYSSYLPTIVLAATSALSTPPLWSAYSSVFHLPLCPYASGILSATRVGGIMIKAGSTTDIASNRVYGMNLSIPTITAYLVPSYVGWRGSSVYHVRKNDVRTAYTSNRAIIQDLSISRSFKAMARMFTNFSVRTPFIFSAVSASQTTQATASLGPNQFFANHNRAATTYSTTGMSGLAITNPDLVAVVDAVIPWYSNFRMAPANPVANLIWSTDYNSLSWNTFDKNSENVGAAQGCINTSVRFQDDVQNSITNIVLHPTLDVYHKAGVDFTAFWYLNPPVVQIYDGKADGYPSGWA